jgi:hypothetical protein
MVIASTTVAALALAVAARGGPETARRVGGTALRTAAGTTIGLDATRRPRGVVEDCSTRSEASFPRVFSDPANLVVGPLALVGAAYTPASTVLQFGGNKFPGLVRAGHRATVELSPRTRTVAGLAYGPLPQGEVHLRDAHRVVTFIACRRGEPSGSSADGKPVTFWSGFVLTRSPRCVPLRVWVDAERAPRRANLRMGVRRCT